MTPSLFALLCFSGFGVSVPLLTWFDRPKKGR
jgi:hypothetical protein